MDNFFNHDVADWLYNSVSKMDHDEAEMFTLFTMYEVHKSDIENNRRTLNRHVEEVQKSILADLHPEVRELVVKALDKDIPYDNRWGKPQPRDGSGKWTRIVIERDTASQPKRATSYDRDKISVRRRNREQFDLSSALMTAEKDGNSFADRWTSHGPNDHSTNERTYRRVEEGAKLLSHVPNQNVQAAAALAQFAGRMGPEAERVMGPAARRTAYRYRGTERQPDRDLDALQQVAERDLRKRTLTQREYNAGGALTPEQKMAASEEAAAKYLYNRLPKKSLATLQLESGKLPPSEGVIISPEGEIVTQAIGYNEDHYLPFNLKNLKGLKGGSYVRTRSSGGLTSEDIYTGLIAGARSITVVSRSGIFTIDFDDDLRGGRRYSDKARQMVDRYAQTLDAVQSAKVTRRGLDPEERAEIREEVETEMEGMGYKHEQVEAEIKRREKEFSSSGQLTKSELERINQAAMEAAVSYGGPKNDGRERGIPADQKKRFNYYRSELLDAAREKKQSRMYQLDAEGYEAAMNALREQFPYYIQEPRVRKLKELGPSEKDSGYVRPNYIRPKAVRAGYFDPDINGHEKFSAAELHYQNGGKHQQRGTAAVGGQGEGEEGGAEKLTPKKLNISEIRAQKVAAGRRKSAIQDAATKASAFEFEQKKFPLLHRYKMSSDSDIENFTAQEVEALLDEIRGAHKLAVAMKVDDENRLHVEAFKQAWDTLDKLNTQAMSRVPFKESDWYPSVVSAVPQRFSEDLQHSQGQDPKLYQKAWARAIRNSGLTGKVPDDVTDAGLRKLQRVHSEVLVTAQALQQNEDDYEAMNRLVGALADAGMDDKQLEALEHRYSTVGPEDLTAVIAEHRKKALGVIELRSILAASGGKHIAPEEPEPADKGSDRPQIADKPEPSRWAKAVEQLEKASVDPAYRSRDQVAFADMAIAVRSGDLEGFDENLRVLPEDVQRIWKDVRKLIVPADDDD